MNDRDVFMSILEKIGRRNSRLVAADIAESVLDIFEKEYPDDRRPRNAVEGARLYADNKITDNQARVLEVEACKAGYLGLNRLANDAADAASCCVMPNDVLDEKTNKYEWALRDFDSAYVSVLFAYRLRCEAYGHDFPRAIDIANNYA